MELEKYDYYGQSAETDKVKIDDSGSGRPIIVRRFQFKYPPGKKGVPTKNQILTPSYIKYLENFLWADALEMVMWPKVVYEKGGFSIFATCQAKRGNIIPYEHMEKLKPLQDTLQAEHKEKSKVL